MNGNPFPEIKRVVIQENKLAAFKSEGPFMGLTVDLMKESGSYIVVASQLLGSNGLWTRDQAAIGGNFIRLYKLFSAMLDQTCQNRSETSFIFSRLAFETIVNIRFLIQEYSEPLIKSYILYSLDHEYKLYKNIQNNIANRAGIVLPIEDRMLKSIKRAFASSGINIEDMPDKKERNWGGKNLFEKASVIGIDEGYLAMFSGPSHDIHGSWMDIYGNHLNVEENGYFSPNPDWGWPRPQMLLTISLVSLDAVSDFIYFIGGNDALDFVSDALEDLQKRLLKVNAYHESYLSNKTWPEI
jgi:hypothetical protein